MQSHEGFLNVSKKESKSKKSETSEEKIETIEDILLNCRDPDKNYIFNDEQIYELTSLTYKIRGKEYPLLSLDNKYFILDIVGYIIIKNANIVIKELKDYLEYDFEDINFTPHDFIFDCNLFNNAKLKYYEELDKTRDTVEIEEGVYTCSKCKSKKTTSFQIQTRSADEGMTSFIKCHDCGKKWKINA